MSDNDPKIKVLRFEESLVPYLKHATSIQFFLLANLKYYMCLKGYYYWY